MTLNLTWIIQHPHVMLSISRPSSVPWKVLRFQNPTSQLEAEAEEQKRKRRRCKKIKRRGIYEDTWISASEGVGKASESIDDTFESVPDRFDPDS